MSDYWLSTKSPLNMHRASYQTDEAAAYLTEMKGIDSAMLAADLGMCEAHVRAYQRKLGLREFVRSPKAKQRWGKERK